MFLDLARQRQSTRNYTDHPVEREKILTCLEAARLAPSACNSQPWRFIVVDDPGLKNKLADAIFSGPYAMNAFAKQAPVLAVIISEKSTFMARIGGFFRGTAYVLMDIGIAGEHFALQAAELGLGSCWIGWFNEHVAKKILDIPKNKKLDAVLALGYTTEPLRPKNRNDLNAIASFNTTQATK